MATLAIVIPAKNEEENLPRLLRSINKQTVLPEQIIVADAHSTDRTRELATELGALVVDGGMPGPGRNRGAEQATTDLILFLDADVELINEKFLEKALAEFEEKGFDIATADVLPLSGSALDRFLHKFYNKYVRIWGDIHPHAPGFFILVRRSLNQAIHGFDEEVLFCEDHDYAIRANKLGKFGFLSSVAIPVSNRRLEKDGMLSIAIKFTLAELHILLLGPIKHNAFNYSFDHKKK